MHQDQQMVLQKYKNNQLFFHVACTLAHTTRTLYTEHLFPGKGVYGGRIVLVLRDMVSLLPHL